LAIGIGLYIEKKVVLPVVLGSLFLIAGVIMMPKEWKCSVPGQNKHLEWGFKPGFYMFVFAAAIALCLYYIKPLSTALIISALFIFSFLFSLIYTEKTVGSFWCWISAAFSVLFVLLNRT
jgi:uncharacterized membrane protein HdeD (DUF308 family)